MSGFTVDEFDLFLPCFKEHWDEYNERFTIAGKLRQRISYGRKNGLLPLPEDKLFFILSYLKNNPLQEYHAGMFGLTQPQCNVLIHLMSSILLKTLKTLGELPERNSLRLDELLKKCRDVLLDGTERPVQRPQDSEIQKSRYSGKKKTHSVKNNVLSSPEKRILWLSRTYAGSVHDKKICDEQPLNLPEGIVLWQDSGFLGHNPENAEIKMPAKKPKGKELTDEQKKSNKAISSFRILVEHAIGGVKKCRIVKDRIRCYKLGFEDLVMLLACGLHNFRISLKMYPLRI
jgi:hypothetical protein